MNNFVTKKKKGIIGGGQLGKMMILEAKKMGYYVTILDPTPNCPAHSICDKHIVANFDDKDALYSLAQNSDCITYEFEHIDYKTLMELSEKGNKIYPDPSCLKIIQNKYYQKNMLKENNIPTPDFYKVDSIEDIKIRAKEFGLPIVLKACTGGYDGKGNFVIRTEDDIDKAFDILSQNKNIPLMVERFVDFSMEISVIACGSLDGEANVYPVAQNLHIDNILHKTIVPANISENTKTKALELTKKIVEIFNGVGIFCVEFFVTKDGDVLVNEIAPRPHNSGHYTIEGCVTSQFENHIRAILGLPLGSTNLISPTIMLNILGEEGYSGDALFLGLDEALKEENVFVHIYGKEKTSPKRKMGHLTCSIEPLEKADIISKRAFEKIKVISK